MTKRSLGPEREEDRIRHLLEKRPTLDEILDALGSESWRVREAAIQAAAEFEDAPRLAEALVDLILEAHPVTRNAALRALGRLGPRATEAISSRSASNPKQRRLLAEAVAQAADPRASSVAIPLLADEDPTVRMAAAEALGRTGGEEARRALLKVLQDRDPMVVAIALEALHRLGARVPFHLLEPLLSVRSLRRPALMLAAESGDPEAQRALMEALDDESESVRLAALTALARYAAVAPAECLPRLSQLLAKRAVQSRLLDGLEHEETSVRRSALELAALAPTTRLWRAVARSAVRFELSDQAVEVLASILARQWPSDLEEGLRAEPELRPPVWRTLARLERLPHRAGSLVDWATGDLASGDPDLVESAAELVGAHGAPGSAPALCEALAGLDPMDPARQTLALALARLAQRHPEATAPVLETASEEVIAAVLPYLVARARDWPAASLVRRLWDSSEPALQTAALEAAAHARDHQWARELIQRAFGHDDENVRRAAALAARDFPELTGRLWSLASDPSPLVRGAVAYAVSHRPSFEAIDRLSRLLETESQTHVLVELLTALARLGGILNSDVTKRLLDHQEPEVLAAALHAARCGPRRHEIAARATGLLGHPDWKVQLEAARTLAYHEEPEPALRALNELAGSPEIDALVAEELRRLIQRLDRGD